MLKTRFLVGKSILSHMLNRPSERPWVTCWITKRCIGSQKNCRSTILSNTSGKQRSIPLQEPQSLSLGHFRMHKEQQSSLPSSKGRYSMGWGPSLPLKVLLIRRNAKGCLQARQLRGLNQGQPKKSTNSLRMSTSNTSFKNTRPSFRKSIKIKPWTPWWSGVSKFRSTQHKTSWWSNKTALVVRTPWARSITGARSISYRRQCRNYPAIWMRLLSRKWSKNKLRGPNSSSSKRRLSSKPSRVTLTRIITCLGPSLCLAICSSLRGGRSRRRRIS